MTPRLVAAAARALLVLGLAATAVLGSPAGAGSTDRPNLLFFLADDLRHDQLGCAGHPIVETPHVDQLAASGLRFTEAFVTTSICASSRASLFTGLPERTTNSTFGRPPLRDALVEASYPVRLREAGYRTGFVGKLGVRMPPGATAKMFEVFRPLSRGPYFRPGPDGTPRHITQQTADHAIEFLEGHDPARPFCLSLSFNAPHAEDGDKKDHFPWPRVMDGKYDDVVPPPPALSDPAVFESHPAFLRGSMNRDRWYWRWDTEEKYQRNVRAYWRMVSGVDHAVGRVLDALEARGLTSNTVVIFSSDNGYYLGERGFAGKWSHYEPSLRVPLIVLDPRAPRRARGRTHDATVLNLDLTATFFDLAGVEAPPMAGRSLRPLLEGRSVENWRDDFFCEHTFDHADIPKWEGVRAYPYVYARYFEQEPVAELLHDLRADPRQLRSFVDDPEYAGVLERLRARCDELRDRYTPRD